MQLSRETAKAVAALVVCFVAFPGSAFAETCGKPDLLESLPPEGQDNVGTNVFPVARYALTAEYVSEPVLFGRAGETPNEIEVTFDRAEGALIALPGPLEPLTRYHLEWPALRGIATATQGRGKTVEFTTGSGPDEELPVFAGVEKISWEVVRPRDECTESQEERYAFDLELAPASDDGGLGSLSVVVFQTRGPHIGEEPRQVHVQQFPGTGKVRVERALADGEGEVCFSAIVRDLTGKVSASGHVERCVTTVEPPFFYGCSVASGMTGTSRNTSGPSNPWGWWGIFAGGAFAAVVRRRHVLGIRALGIRVLGIRVLGIRVLGIRVGAPGDR